MNARLNQLSRYTSTSETHRLLRYMLVGGLSTAVDFTLLVVLKSMGLTTVLANSLSYSAGIIVSFTLHHLWTYSDSRSKRMSLQLTQFCAISLCGLLLSSGIVAVLTSGSPSSAYLPAKFIATSVVLIWNFAANRHWTFNDVP